MGGNDPLPPITSMGDEVKQDGGNNGKGGRRGNDGRWRKEGRKEIKTRVSRDDNNVGLLIFAVLRQNLSEGRQAGRTLTEVEEERRVKNEGREVKKAKKVIGRRRKVKREGRVGAVTDRRCVGMAAEVKGWGVAEARSMVTLNLVS